MQRLHQCRVCKARVGTAHFAACNGTSTARGRAGRHRLKNTSSRELSQKGTGTKDRTLRKRATTRR
jgi:hypothetical protein